MLSQRLATSNAALARSLHALHAAKVQPALERREEEMLLVFGMGSEELMKTDVSGEFQDAAYGVEILTSSDGSVVRVSLYLQ